VNRDRRVWRGFLLGTVLLPLNALWVLYMEHIGAHGPIPSTISLFFNVVFILFFLALANLAVHKLRPQWALNRGELIIIYVMLAMGTSLAGLDGMQVLIPVMTHGFWFANPENQWDQLLANAPPWLVVSDQQVLYDYYNGASTLYQWDHIYAWLAPVMWWTGFIVVLVFVMICLSVLVRAQWADRERLTFPIIQLPLAITEPHTPLWRNPLLWIGFAAAGSIDLINGLHYLFPNVPYLSIAPTFDNYAANDLMKYVTDMPWTAIGWLPVTLYPAVIGIAFLVPLDLLFSCVFFFFWWKAMLVLSAALGFSQGYAEEMSKSVFPYMNEQMFGGYLAIALAPILVGRRYFRHVWRRIIGRASEADDSREGMSYRTAFIGVVVGMGLLAAFSIHGGLSPGLAILFFVMYYVVSLAVARVRAEFGSPVHDFHWAGPLCFQHGGRGAVGRGRLARERDVPESADVDPEPDTWARELAAGDGRRLRDHDAAGDRAGELFRLALPPRRLRAGRELVYPPGVDADAHRLGGEVLHPPLRRAPTLPGGASSVLRFHPRRVGGRLRMDTYRPYLQRPHLQLLGAVGRRRASPSSRRRSWLPPTLSPRCLLSYRERRA